jgi:molybdopterin synthase sulfur carrier subunit
MQVRLFGNLRRSTGQTSGRIAVTASGATVRDVLLDLCATYPSLQEEIFDGQVLGPHVRVMINGHDIEFADGLDTAVSDEDQLAIFPPIAGG